MLRLDRVFLKGAGVRIEAATATSSTVCPGCGTPSGRVHSRYVRRLADTGVGGRHGRHTRPAEQVVESVAMALGGRAGARLTGRLAVPVSRMTLLRVIRRVPDPPAVTLSPTPASYAEIRGRGYRGSPRTLQRFLVQARRQRVRTRPHAAAVRPPTHRLDHETRRPAQRPGPAGSQRRLHPPSRPGDAHRSRARLQHPGPPTRRQPAGAVDQPGHRQRVPRTTRLRRRTAQRLRRGQGRTDRALELRGGRREFVPEPLAAGQTARRRCRQRPWPGPPGSMAARRAWPARRRSGCTGSRRRTALGRPEDLQRAQQRRQRE